MKSRIKVISCYSEENKSIVNLLNIKGYDYKLDVLNFIPEDLVSTFMMDSRDTAKYAKDFVSDVKKTSPNIELFVFEHNEDKYIYSDLMKHIVANMVDSKIEVVSVPVHVREVQFVPIKNGEFVNE